MTLSADISRRIDNRFEQSQNDLVLQASDFSLKGLREMVENEVIDLSPKYQRRERWEPERQSQLIESFLLNVPVPPIYLAEEGYGQYSIIDGKQRITAVSEFLANSLALKGLSSFSDLNGLRFLDLPRSLQNALQIRPYLRVITLLKQSNPLLKYEVFIRLNKGGIELNNQEIRNVAFRGLLNNVIYECAENAHLRDTLKIGSDNKASAYKQMLDAEYVLRFFTLLDGWKKFSGDLSRSMDQFMLDNRDAGQEMIDGLRTAFIDAIQTCDDLWGEHKFQRWDGERWRKQALAGLYDAQMLAVASLGKAGQEKVREKSSKICSETKLLFNNLTFDESVRLGTNTPSRLIYRVKAVQNLLEGAL
jgi:hypothetical protein